MQHLPSQRKKVLRHGLVCPRGYAIRAIEAPQTGATTVSCTLGVSDEKIKSWDRKVGLTECRVAQSYSDWDLRAGGYDDLHVIRSRCVRCVWVSCVSGDQLDRNKIQHRPPYRRHETMRYVQIQTVIMVIVWFGFGFSDQKSLKLWIAVRQQV